MLTDQFPPATAQAWWAVIEKELKGKSLADLSWEPEAGLLLQPFYTPENQTTAPLPIPPEAGNDWEIGEWLSTEQGYTAAHQALMIGLDNGVQSPLVDLQQLPTLEEWGLLLDGVYPDFIRLRFCGAAAAEQPQALLSSFDAYLQTQHPQTNPATLRGAVIGRLPFGEVPPTIGHTAPSALWHSEELPAFATTSIALSNTPTYAASTTAALLALHRYCELTLAQALPLDQAIERLVFCLEIGDNFYLDLARLRVVRALSSGIIRSYAPDLAVLPKVEAFILPDTNVDREVNNVAATIKAHCAVLGGIDSLTLLPQNKEQATAFDFRLVRNIQHILQQESHLNRVADPTLGSHYLETLTAQLAQKVWSEFQLQVEHP